MDFKETQLEPLGDKVLVQPDPITEKTESGIHIPESVLAQHRPDKGTVISKSVDVKGVEAGDRVLFYKHGAVDVHIADKKLLIMSEKNLWAILKA